MRQAVRSIGLVLTLLVIGTGCGSGSSTPAPGSALMSPASSPGREQNDEGVGHYKQGHWDVAEGHFRKAVKADPNLAEAHYNLGLALDKMGKHPEATEAFKKAAELAPDKPAIKDSEILKKHLAMDTAPQPAPTGGGATETAPPSAPAGGGH